MYCTRNSCQILTELEFSRQVSEKKTQIPNFVKIRPGGSQMYHEGGRTDRYVRDEDNRRSLLFCERA